MNTNIQELSIFNKACDELVSGKYILIDVKINYILSAINNDPKIKDIVLNCTNECNFVDLFNSATIEGKFITPNSPKQIISLVFNLLYRIKNKDIDFYEFLNLYFNEDENAETQFSTFSNKIILPFKQAVGELFIKSHLIVESAEYQNNHYNKIKTTVNLILNNMSNFKLNDNDKQEFTLLLNSLYKASENNDKNLVYSLMIGLDYFTKCNKKLRKTYLSLEECFG